MTIATLAYVAHGPYTYSIAGASPTIAETLLGIHDAIVNHATLWQVSDWSVPNGTLEIKRIPTQTGELATVRLFLCGGQVPHANALAGGHSAGSATGLYGSLSVDANTTGPAASYASAAPYTTKYTRMGLIGLMSSLTAAQTPKITIIEADDVFGVIVADSLGMMSWFGGNIILRTSDNTLLWGSLPTGGIYTYTTTAATISALTAAFPITVLSSASNSVKATYWDGSAARQFGRLFTPIAYAFADTTLGVSGAAAALLPIVVGETAQATAQTPSFLGFLRQMRWGPIAQHLQNIRDGSSVLKATCVNGGNSANIGIWLSVDP